MSEIDLDYIKRAAEIMDRKAVPKTYRILLPEGITLEELEDIASLIEQMNTSNFEIESDDN